MIILASPPSASLPFSRFRKVRIAEAPGNLIHFNGECLLSPYSDTMPGNQLTTARPVLCPPPERFSPWESAQ